MFGISEDVKVLINTMQDDTIIAKTLMQQQQFQRSIAQSLREFDPANRKYSAFLKGNATNSKITHELLDQLTQNCRNEVDKIVNISSLIENEITQNGIIGKTYEVIETNLNTDYKLTYRDFTSNKTKSKQLSKVKELIDNFNEYVGIEQIIANSILNTYATGNEVLYLRGNANSGYNIDVFPLKVVEVSSYKYGNDPICMVNIKVLKDQLKKTMLKLKSGKAMFFETVEQEIKKNYPDEVYKAYKNNENYAILEPDKTYIMRINNLNKKYGLSPIFKALKDNLMLESFKEADRLNAEARAKKILVQYLSDKLLDKGKTYGQGEMAYAHGNLMSAWGQKIVVTTPPAYVTKIEYVEPKVEMTDQNTYQEYRNNVLNALGIGFLATQTGNSVSTANISVKQLMNTINAISKECERAINKFYKAILLDNKIGLDYVPKISIIDSEMMEFDLRKELSEFVFNRLNASYETAYGILGLDVEDEKQKRITENDNGFDKIFTPHQTSATFSTKQNNNTVDKDSDKKSDNPDKHQYDENYNDKVRK